MNRRSFFRPEFRQMLDGRFEIENAVNFPSDLGKNWLKRATRNGFEIGKNEANSLYLDHQFGLYQAGLSLRVRLKGVFVPVGKPAPDQPAESFPNQFALKEKHEEFSRLGRLLVSRLYEDSRQIEGRAPLVRHEVEGAHNWPQGVHELRFSDLPYEGWLQGELGIGQRVEQLMYDRSFPGVRKLDQLVFRPLVITNVRRKKLQFFAAPDQRYDFVQTWPSPYPTKAMVQSGNYVCIEAVVDRCVARKPPHNLTIDDIVSAARAARQSFLVLEKRHLFEYEVVGKKCGPSLTDAGALLGHSRCAEALFNFAEQQGRLSGFAESSRRVYPVDSKAAMATRALIRHLQQQARL